MQTTGGLRTIVGRLTFACLAALVVLAVLAVIGYTILKTRLRSTLPNATLVRLSARQRMLCERIGLLANVLPLSRPGTHRDSLRQRLLGTVHRLETSHRRLTRGDPSAGLPPVASESLRAIYFQQPLRVDGQVRNLVEHARALAGAPDAQLTLANRDRRIVLQTVASEALVRGLAEAVRAHENDAEADIRMLEYYGGIFLIIALAGLVLIGGLIFRPTIRLVRQEFARRQEAEQRLQDLNQTLEDQVAERTGELARGKGLLEAVMDSVGDGVAVADRDGRFLLWNDAAGRLLGKGPVDTGPDSWTAAYGIFEPDQRTPCPDERLPLVRALRGEAVDDEELFIRNPGVPVGVWLSVSGRPLQSGGDALHGGVVVFRDMTERKRAQRDLLNHEARLLAARQIQERLLPETPPTVPGFDIAGVSHAAHIAGGDYLDFLRLPDGSLGIVIGDVTGHGLDAGLIMSLLHGYMHAYVETHTDVSEILGRINGHLVAATPEDRFCTAVLARLDPETRRLVYANAGHDAGVVLDASGTLKQELASTSLPLGFEPDLTFPAGPEVTLEVGDLLVLFTDGVPEARSPDDEFFGRDRAIEVVRGVRNRPAADIAAALWEAVRDFTAAEPGQDDVTVAVLKALPV